MDNVIRNKLIESVVVCGGGSSIKNISTRLIRELHLLSPPSIKPCNVACPEYMPRDTLKYSAWMGGSILAKVT